MVYIILDVGSKAKGYDIISSDYDYIIITKSSADIYAEEWIEDNKRLINRHSNKKNNNDITFVDISKAFMGIIKGNYYFLGIYGTKENIKNDMIFYFVRYITKYYISLILKTMTKYQINNTSDREPKNLLALLYNLSYVNYWLKNNDFPVINKLPELLEEDKIELYNILMMKRLNNELATEEQGSIIQDYRKVLLENVNKLEKPKKIKNISNIIMMYLICNKPLYIPEILNNDDEINKIIYPSIKQLNHCKNSLLYGKEIFVQEKLDGCNFRIIYNNGIITFGSRYTYYENKNFMNYYRIKDKLIDCTNKINKFLNLKKFIIYGELIGSYQNDEGINKLIIKNVNYFNDNRIEYYAYEIKNCDNKNKIHFIDFDICQIVLNAAGFNVINYETIKYNDFIENIKYKSIVFNHNDESKVEGYIIRYKNIRYKVKKSYNLTKLTHKNILYNITEESVLNFINNIDINQDNVLYYITKYYKNLIHMNNIDNNVPIYKIFGKIYGFINKKYKFNDNNIYKNKLSEFYKLL
ncbi:hypothetical protein AMV019 [Betaentomopoxvirus amoorei]|uniref:AMV019 n=1 Tax=Amsacta moorei entomopoxvirus TaxID=28321 RepID=Q9EN29_AMEPV|nr:hypothetical protein AMV019 [Amsacta moorei entomopoxvirus]AAG02725.1 AMV019 [Amsacta moorei entomopoxvirus]